MVDAPEVPPVQGTPLLEMHGIVKQFPGVRALDGVALELVRSAGRTIGTVLASLVNFFNPHRIVMTGGVAQAGVPLLAGIREAVYQRSLPLAARSLEITVSEAPDLSGRMGAALMAIEGFLDEASVDQAIAR